MINKLNNITFEHLSEAPHYLDHLDSFENSKVGFSFLSYLKDNLKMDIASIFITNHNIHFDRNVTYVLRLERDKIELYEESDVCENRIVYQFSDDSISLNSKKMTPIFINAFKNRLSEIIRDLKRNRSTIFEEVIAL